MGSIVRNRLLLLSNSFCTVDIIGGIVDEILRYCLSLTPKVLEVLILVSLFLLSHTFG
jgi:energy-converting hydrogenase Eha subunit F